MNTPEHAVLYKHPLLEKITSEIILSKLCLNTFGKFAISQIKKSKGLNKKILNPLDKKRKSILEFCFVNYEAGSIPLTKFLKLKNETQEHCGLINIPHMKNMFGLYLRKNLGYKGVIKNDKSNDINLSSIPKGEKQSGLMFFNREGYSSYCKEYKEYWEWVGNRNESRYENTLDHGKNYDAKNMMHTFRLLEMAIEIAQQKTVNVKRDDRDFLLQIKAGEFEYDRLLDLAKQKQQEMEEAFLKSDLPEKPDLALINKMTYKIREEFYQNKVFLAYHPFG